MKHSPRVRAAAQRALEAVPADPFSARAKARTTIVQIRRRYEEGAGFSDVANWLTVVLRQVFWNDTPQKTALLSALDSVSVEMQEQSGKRINKLVDMVALCKAELQRGGKAAGAHGQLQSLAGLRLKLRYASEACPERVPDELLDQVEDVLVNIPLKKVREALVAGASAPPTPRKDKGDAEPRRAFSGEEAPADRAGEAQDGPEEAEAPLGDGPRQKRPSDCSEASASDRLRRQLSLQHEARPRSGRGNRGPTPSKEHAQPSKDSVQRQLVVDSDSEGGSEGGIGSKADEPAGPAPEAGAPRPEADEPAGPAPEAGAPAIRSAAAGAGSPRAATARLPAPGPPRLRAGAPAALERRPPPLSARPPPTPRRGRARPGGGALYARAGASAPGSPAASLQLLAVGDARSATPPWSAPGCARMRPAPDGIEAVVAARQARCHAQARCLLSSRGADAAAGRSTPGPAPPEPVAPGREPVAFGRRLSSGRMQDSIDLQAASPAQAAEGRRLGATQPSSTWGRGSGCAGGPAELWARRPRSQGLRDSLWRKKIVVVDEHLPRRRGAAASRSAAGAR